MTSSTLQQYSSHPTQVYYGDESDEGLVKIFFCSIEIMKKQFFFL
jgi:hypothetical protein